MTETSGTDGSEGRIAILEKKVRDMDALVKALIEELLDFKAIARGMSKQNEDFSLEGLKEWPTHDSTVAGPSISLAASADGSIVIRPKGAGQTDVPAEPAMVRIMQSDGTMKLEPRYGDKNHTDGAAGYGRTRKGML